VVSIYVQNPKWFLRPRNTDWRYLRFMLPRIQEFEPECRFYASRSLRGAWRANARYARQVLNRKLGYAQRDSDGSYLDRGEFARSHCDAVFCHDDFPRNAEGVPVIWQNSLLDPAMQRARGHSQEDLAAQRALKGAGFEKARAVQVSTRAEQLRLAGWFPHIASKFVVVPFFLPDVKPISSTQQAEKIGRKGPLRCLFVGHEAKRKGLERVYAAMTGLSSSLQQHIQLTVVSSQSDGPIHAPSLPNLRITGALPYRAVQQLFQDSDVFLMPSFFESYGLAFPEAMAQGTIPVVPDWEVQREIVDNGRCGIVTSGDSTEISRILERLCDDASYRANLSVQARERFLQCFDPKIVARQFHSLFRQVLGR